MPPHLDPLSREELPEFAEVFDKRDVTHGYVPNAWLTMGRNPGLLQGFVQLVESVYYNGTVDPTLKRMVAIMRSSAAGCQYCQAHTSTHAVHGGIDVDRLNAMWEFETDDRFSGADRAALRLARDAAVTPNAVTDEHFTELRKYFDDDELTEIIGVICTFAFINSWNDTVATTLEETPLDVASASLDPDRWQPGKHAPPTH